MKLMVLTNLQCCMFLRLNNGGKKELFHAFRQFATDNLVKHKQLVSCFLPADSPSTSLMQTSLEADVCQCSGVAPTMV